MAFLNGCACHVWAIDGWIDDDVAHDVNENYSHSADAMLFGAKPPGGLSGRIARLLGDSRVTPAVAEAGVLYGFFQNVNDGAPEHMWFEYNGYIYDTMPGSPIRRIPADAMSRMWPPSEQNRRNANLVGSTYFSLTATQHQIITTAAWDQPEGSARAGLATYLPPG